MTQEQLNAVFQSELGQQIDLFYVVNLPNNAHQIHISLNEAINVAKEYNQSDDCIDEYFAEWNGKDLFPIARKFE